ncbi:MAG: hypothetical protein JJE30_07435 [Desulfuromonadales bacterium]|nr:hypothetical protein [Desulfuromonadales bacterium]
MKIRTLKKAKLLIKKVLATTLCLTMILPVMPAMAAPGGVITTPALPPGFLFEPESAIGSLKDEAQWNEVEQLLDNPYAVVLDPATPGNDQGFPSYRTDPNAGFQRRRSFLPAGCTYDASTGLPLCNDALLTQFLVHPLNYNPTTGIEMRVINSGFPGATWGVPSELALCTAPGVPVGCPTPLPAGVATFAWQYTNMFISAGADRVEPGSTPIDYNAPIASGADPATFIVTTEVNPPEGSFIYGADPGEPNYLGFGSADASQYSTAAIPGATAPVFDANGVLLAAAGSTAGLLLSDPERGTILARDFATQAGGLKKPSIGRPQGVGTSYPVLNVDSNNMAAANENDFIAGNSFAAKQAARHAAETLGKALFWDQQVGSDGVQACGSCHVTAGVDPRTKNQLNPDHLGGDFTFQLHGPNANQEVTAADFPLHKLANPLIPGEPMLNPGNVNSDVNDVVSSMGVIFGIFGDIPAPGPAAFLPAAGGDGVAALKPDLRSPNAADNIDPIPGFRGLRRVEPRNTPTMHAAAFNFDNFWDGRARHDFNGGSVFGASDPQTHVFMNNGTTAGALTPTRQIIRFSSLASLATGPALSNFEMSFNGRSWQKIGKKLLQAGVTPLANQLVDITDSELGPFSNQGGSACGALTADEYSGSFNGSNTAVGKPGLCISYPALIKRAFYPQLWANTGQHLNGAPAGCSGAVNGLVFNNVLNANTNGGLTPSDCDPFDGYKLTLAAGPVVAADTNQFTQMEANMSLFFGLSVQLWVQVLVPDDTPLDRFFDQNPDATSALGESGEPLLVQDRLNCTTPGVRNGPTLGNPTGECFTPVAPFLRDASLFARINPFNEGGTATAIPVTSSPSRSAGAPDPLLGFDLFQGTNLSLKNPNFRSARCGGCHLGPFLTDHNISRTHAQTLGDFVAEFLTPGVELQNEPLGRDRLISGFLLESELNEVGQDAIERFIVNQNLIPDPVSGLAFPESAFLDNGMYNIGIRPSPEDTGRGGNDPFGWPLSLATLAFKNLGGPNFTPGRPLPNFDPDLGIGGGLFEPDAQDQQLNPGLEGEPANPLLPPYLAPWVNNINVGNTHPEMDELFGGVNTLTQSPIMEGYIDTVGPFDPAGTVNEAMNMASGPLMGTWPTVNRVGKNGSFKAPQLRNVELTGPYFHNGGMLTLRQVVDFYARGGDFPATNGGAVECDGVHTAAHPFAPGKCYDVNTSHRDMMILNLREEVQSLGRLDPVGSGNPAVAPYPDGFTLEQALNALVDFLISLTDERVAHQQAPFDRPQIILPIDGTAPDNTLGRAAMLADNRYKDFPAIGAAGVPERTPAFLGISNQRTIDGTLSQFSSVTNPNGDINNDGVVNIADALLALRIAVGLVPQPTGTALFLGDVAPQGAPNGSIDLADALVILRKIVGATRF